MSKHRRTVASFVTEERTLSLFSFARVALLELDSMCVNGRRTSFDKSSGNITRYEPSTYYEFYGDNVSKLNQLWTLAISWITKKIRSPFSNYATKFVLVLGGAIIATPLLEHLIINAVLKHGLGIDLGIEVPGIHAYIAGGCLIALSLMHNLLFIKLNHDHQIRVKDVEISVYKSIWEKLDTVLDDTARLSNLYCTHYSAEDAKLALKAEEAVISCTDWLRKNRPFYFSEYFYTKCVTINNEAYVEIRAFRGCLKAKIQEEKSIGRNASFEEQLEYYEKNYNYDLAQKDARRTLAEIQSKYDDVCEDIRAHVSAI